MFHRIAGVVAVAVVALAAAEGRGQNGDVLRRWYGSGVHAYFAGDTAQADRALSHAIDGGTTDPRAYYFRALNYLRMGQTGAAQMDMTTGAVLEVRDTDGRYPVSRSLERVQGRRRQLLERYRRQARSDAFQQEQTRRQQRYETLRTREQDVLRRQVTVPLEQLAVPSGDAPIAERGATEAKSPVAPGERTAPVVKPPEQVVPAEVPAQEPAPPDPFAEAPDQEDPGAATTTIRSVPEAEKVTTRRLGKILTRVIGKSLPGDAPVAAAARAPGGGVQQSPEDAQIDPFKDVDEQAPEEPKDPFGDEPADGGVKTDDADTAEPAAEDPFGDEQVPSEDDSSEADGGQDATDGTKPATADPFGSDDQEDEPADGDPFAGG